MTVTQKFETTSGTVWSKSVDSDGNATYRKDGNFASQQSYAAASTHKDTVYVRNGESEPDRPASVPVPDGDGGVEYADVETRDAREIGRRIMADDRDMLPGQDTYEINGQRYDIDDLGWAYLEADRDDSVVRYAI